jgi:branched-chain amino acid transport system ATP-binding protein
MSKELLRVENLSKVYGGLAASSSINLSLRAGETHALIGPNGAGKTTLIAQITGEVKPDAGSILFGGRDITSLPVFKRARLGLARSFQITSLMDVMSVFDNVLLAVMAHAGSAFGFGRPARAEAGLRKKALEALAMAGLEGVEAALPGALSHGQRRQLELAMALAGRPRLLLLDEPMAGLGPGESRQMVALLEGLKGRYSMLLVEHDMDAVFALADRISVLVAGELIATGTPRDIRRNARVRAAYLGGEAETC